MSVLASPAKVELTLAQANTILQNLSLLTYSAHKYDKLSYSATSITLGTSLGVMRKASDWLSYYSGSQVTNDLAALLPLIHKVQKCITANPLISTDISERTSCMELMNKAVKGLEALKVNQYEKQDKKQEEIDKSIEVLRSAHKTLDDKHAEWRDSTFAEMRVKRLEEEARQREKDELLIKLKEENRILRVQAAAAGNTPLHTLSAAKLVELAQECLKLASAEMNQAQVRAEALKKSLP